MKLFKFTFVLNILLNLGAALVFNNIYRDLREDINILNQYWIELLYYFVKSLSLSLEDDFNNNETSNALDHIKRVLSEKSEIFNEVIIFNFDFFNLIFV